MQAAQPRTTSFKKGKHQPARTPCPCPRPASCRPRPPLPRPERKIWQHNTKTKNTGRASPALKSDTYLTLRGLAGHTARLLGSGSGDRLGVGAASLQGGLRGRGQLRWHAMPHHTNPLTEHCAKTRAAHTLVAEGRRWPGPVTPRSPDLPVAAVGAAAATAAGGAASAMSASLSPPACRGVRGGGSRVGTPKTTPLRARPHTAHTHLVGRSSSSSVGVGVGGRSSSSVGGKRADQSLH